MHATDRQIDFIDDLIHGLGYDPQGDPAILTRSQASTLIAFLLKCRRARHVAAATYTMSFQRSHR